MNEIVNLGNGQFVKVMMLKGQQGDNIQSIAKTSTNVLVDTYTITLTDGSTKTFTVTNGKGIVSIEKTGTSGLVDTYTITYNDNTTSTFEVTNGKSIVSIEKTDTNVLVDTYTITFNSGDPVTFTVTNGKGINSIAKTGTSGLVDTYTITYNDNTTSTFDVTNGANGQDVSQSNLAPVEIGNSASQSYTIGQHLIWNGVYYKVIQAIAVGDAFVVDANLSARNIGSEITDLQNNIGSTNDTQSLDGTIHAQLKYIKNRSYRRLGSTYSYSPINITWQSFFDGIASNFLNDAYIEWQKVMVSINTQNSNTRKQLQFTVHTRYHSDSGNYAFLTGYDMETDGTPVMYAIKAKNSGSKIYKFSFASGSFTRTDISTTNISTSSQNLYRTAFAETYIVN